MGDRIGKSLQLFVGGFQFGRALDHAVFEIPVQLNRDLENRVIKRTAELEAANKELEGFSYSVSHDLRAPLRGIAGFAQLLVSASKDKIEQDGQRWLGIIQSETQRMGRLIDELLNFSRLGRQQISMASLD